MLYKKKGLPEENSIVLCTVKKILFHSIFVDLDEFENREGMIHISEIAPGRIRNIRDYVKEGKKLVCLVLRIDREKGHIDLSLRRISMSLRNQKMEEYRQELKSEKLFEYIAKQLKTDVKSLYLKVGGRLVEEFGLLSYAFNEIAVRGEEAVRDLNLPKKEMDTLISIVQEKIKPVEVKVDRTLVLESFSESGIDDVKAALLAGEHVAEKEKIKATLLYASAPKYRIETYAKDYKEAEEGIEKISSAILKTMKQRGGRGEMESK